MEINTNGKMKIVGYGILGFALLITILMLLGVFESTPDKIGLMQFWAGVGISLLFGNAGKHIVGNYVKKKEVGQ